MAFAMPMFQGTGFGQLAVKQEIQDLLEDDENVTIEEVLDIDMMVE